MYLYYLVSGLEARLLCWRVHIHGSDVLAWSGALAVQVEPVSIGPSPDHTETWPQLGAHLLEEARGANTRVNKLYGTCINTAKQELVEIPPAWASALEEREAQRLWRAPESH